MIERQQLNGKRMAMVLLTLLDLVALVALFLQLSDSGFPKSIEMLADSLNSHSLKEFWFIPFAVACAFPFIGALGAILFWQYLLWTYCGYLVGLTGLRLYFLFEAGKREGLDNRDDLLLDMMLLTFGIFLQIYIFQSASTLGLLVRRLKLQDQLHSATPTSTGGSTGGSI